MALSEAWRKWNDALNILRENNFPVKIIDTGKLYVKGEGRVEPFKVT